MIKPIPYSKIEKELGTHEESRKHDLVIVPVPFRLRLSWKPTYIDRVMVHPRIAYEFESALDIILDYYGIKFIQEHYLDEFGGTFNARKSRGSDRWSVHAWAMAVDYVPSLGKFNTPALTPAPIVDAFKSQGFLWGGDWKRPDGMHFTGVIE